MFTVLKSVFDVSWCLLSCRERLEAVEVYFTGVERLVYGKGEGVRGKSV